jgi:hypothetical protein
MRLWSDIRSVVYGSFSANLVENDEKRPQKSNRQRKGGNAAHFARRAVITPLTKMHAFSVQ